MKLSQGKANPRAVNETLKKQGAAGLKRIVLFPDASPRLAGRVYPGALDVDAMRCRHPDESQGEGARTVRF